MKNGFIKDLVDDLKGKIKWTKKLEHKPEHYCHQKSDYDSEEGYSTALKQAEGAVKKAVYEDKVNIKYFEDMIKKVKSLKKNPQSLEEKELWLEVMGELFIDFKHNHCSGNQGLGRAGEIILRCVFDMEGEINGIKHS